LRRVGLPSWRYDRAGLQQSFDFLLTLDAMTCINAALITIATTALFASLFSVFRTESLVWSVVALVFVPVHTGLNLLAYLTQMTMLPRLLTVYLSAGGEPG
jgi:hypothetical protein